MALNRWQKAAETTDLPSLADRRSGLPTTLRVRAYSCGPMTMKTDNECGAAFAKPDIYECLEERRVFYAMRLPSNDVLQREIAPLLIRPLGRPPKPSVVLSRIRETTGGSTRGRCATTGYCSHEE